MPLFAYLSTEVKCPSCHSTLTDMVWFQWAYCPARAPLTEYIYHLGDKMLWETCQDGTIKAWTYFKEGGNLGDPQFKNLVMKVHPEGILSAGCPNCHLPLAGIALEIKNDIATRVWAYSSHELDDTAIISVLTEDGIYLPMPEWDDHPMTTTEHC